MSKKIVVQHDWYGCETGCCGTAFVFFDDDVEFDRDWEFEHFTKEEAHGEATTKRATRGDEWNDVPIELGELRCFDEQTAE